MDKYSRYAPALLRIALAALFLWFGASQMQNTAAWASIVPPWATGIAGLSAFDIVHLNGIFEILAGILLAVGIGVRWVALLLALHLVPIALSLWPGAIAVRDLTLTAVTFSSALFGTDDFCYAPFSRKKV